jgi:hypothetical protein
MPDMFTSEELSNMMNEHYLKNGKWNRTIWGADAFFTITTDRYTVKITGGSIVVLDRSSGTELKRLKGFNYLYTGDVKPDESEIFALENGKHFYIISLKDFSQKRFTLPRTYSAVDVYGTYSADGRSLFIPVNRYAGDKYEYCICEYETENYSLVKKEPSSLKEINHW